MKEDVMKKSVSIGLSFILCLLALLAVSASAQDQELQDAEKKAAAEKALKDTREKALKDAQDKALKDTREKALKDAQDKALKVAEEEEIVKFKKELLNVVGEKIGFEMKVVKGAPYTATAEAETVQTLVDGNRIRNKTTTNVYRDSEGRTRRESLGKEQSVPTEVFISDPSSGVNYTLDARRHIAVKSQVKLTELDLEKMKYAAELEMKQLEIKRRARDSGQDAQAEDEEIAKKKRKPIVESLGQQLIEGVMCDGRRATSTIPAGAVGNDQPITILNEQWYSPELQVYVLTKQSDPRSGETVYRLTNINRGEPDHALFEVPADYTLRDQSTSLPLKKRKPPEEER